MVQVQNTLFKVGSVLQSKNWGGPTIGIKSATENHRNFDEDKQRAGRNVIGLQVNHINHYQIPLRTKTHGILN